MASRISLPEIFVAAGFSFCRGQVLGIEVCLDLLGQLQPGLVLCVGVGVHQDRCRRMTRVALHRLEVTVRLQELVGGTGVPQTVEHDLFKLWMLGSPQATFSGSPSQGHRRVSHADGHAVFKVQRAKRQQKSRHKTDQPCLRFFWKVMLVGYVTAESQDVQPRRV